MTLTSLFLYVLLGGITTILFIHYLKARPNSPRRIRCIQEARMLLRKSTLESRAAPNQRLVAAFGINNAFTTIDPVYHKRFVNEAKDLIRTTNEEWNKLAISTSNFVSEELLPLLSNDPRPVPLVTLVQGLVFRVVLIKIFPGTPLPPDTDIEGITATINSLWLASKSCSNHPNDESLMHARVNLHQTLAPFVQHRNAHQRASEKTGEGNPLNWILPAYETLWRVVLHCFLEVRFRSNPADLTIYQNLFSTFLAGPTQAIFNTPTSRGAITVKNIVDEALRLYPPTRRINRQPISSSAAAIDAIDIEFLHRDPNAWGGDALDFRPRRRGAGKVEKPAYLPFGMGSFECPAKNTFGPMMIGVLVGALMGGVREWVEIVGEEGEKGGGLKEGPLEGGRESYRGLVLKVVGS